MNSYVIDASVAMKWYLPEPHSADAEKLLSGEFRLLAPDLIVSEVGNILWKRAMRSELSVPKAKSILAAFAELPLTILPANVLAESAMTIACGLKRTFYDSIYLALAMTADCRLVTADRKLFEAVVKDTGPAKQHILWVEDIPEHK